MQRIQDQKIWLGNMSDCSDPHCRLFEPDAPRSSGKTQPVVSEGKKSIQNQWNQQMARHTQRNFTWTAKSLKTYFFQVTCKEINTFSCSH